jgi:hypothetical protein
MPKLTVIALDTHEVVKELKAAGFSEEQAEALTRVVRRSQDVDLSNLVTKTEFQAGMAAAKSDLETGLAAVRAEVQAEFAAVRGEIRTGLAETKAEILNWMVGSMGVQTVVILGTVAAIVRVIVH